jgi:hypothetical protein
VHLGDVARPTKNKHKYLVFGECIHSLTKGVQKRRQKILCDPLRANARLKDHTFFASVYIMCVCVRICVHDYVFSFIIIFYIILLILLFVT